MSSKPKMTSCLVCAALAVLAYYGTVVATARIGRMFGESPGFSTSQMLATVAGSVAAMAVASAALVATVPYAAAGRGWTRRLANALPSFLVILAVIGGFLYMLEIGTVGGVVDVPVLGSLTFIHLWIAFTSMAAVVSVALSRHWLVTERTASRVRALLRLALAGLAVALIALGALLFIMLSSEPAGNGFGGAPQPAPLPVLVAGIVLIALLTGVAWRRMREHASAESQPTTGSVSRAAAQTGGESAEARGLNVAGSWLALAAVALGASQLVPVPRDNPPVRTVMQWDSEETEQLWARACADCHSNETRWPWYSQMAPASWLMAAHVDAARDGLNVSQIDEVPPDEIVELPERLERAISSGWMPPRDFLIMHPEARLSEAEKERLIAGLERTLQNHPQAHR